MNIGIAVPLPAYKVDVAFMVRTAEVLGFESFWCAEQRGEGWITPWSS